MTNQSRYSYTTSWAVGRRFRSDRRIAPMSRKCAGANLAINVRNSASADRRAAADCVLPGTSSTRSLRRRSEEHTSELQSRFDLVCRLLLEKKKTHHLLNATVL